MVVVKLTYRHIETITGLFVYLEHYFSEISHDHRKLLYGFEDKWKNLCYENRHESIVKSIYCIDPSIPEYTFLWKGVRYSVHITNLEPHHLYKSSQNQSLFEPVYVVDIEVEGTDTQPIHELLLRSLEYASQWDNINTSTKEVNVYHWVDDFWEKLTTLEKRSIDTIYLPENEKNGIVEDLNHFLSSETKKCYSEFGIPYHRTYCLHGPPGTGKSSLIFSLVSEFSKNIGVLSLSRKTDDQSFVRAVSSIPKNTVLLLEDIDCLLGERSDKHSQITFSALLNCLDGIQSKQGLVMFITTNYIMKLDPAFCRPGRIDYILEFHYTTKSQIFQMLRKFFPSQSDKFDTFYQSIKQMKVTTCILQKYLFQRYPNKDILWNIEDIKKEVDMSKFEKHPEEMYI